MVVHQNITNLAGYFHFLNVRKIPYVIRRGSLQTHGVLQRVCRFLVLKTKKENGRQPELVLTNSDCLPFSPQ